MSGQTLASFEFLPPTETMERDAVIPDCGKYRYLLRRAWNHDKPRALFIMLNPSTADAEIDDATIRSCIRLSKALGHGSFEVINLFGWRATDPAELMDVGDPIGPDNDGICEAAIMRCDIAIAAWGAHAMASGRGTRVCNMVRARRPAIYCLGTTKSGAPKHPLYLKTGTPLQVYRL